MSEPLSFLQPAFSRASQEGRAAPASSLVARRRRMGAHSKVAFSSTRRCISQGCRWRLLFSRSDVVQLDMATKVRAQLARLVIHVLKEYKSEFEAVRCR